MIRRCPYCKRLAPYRRAAHVACAIAPLLDRRGFSIYRLVLGSSLDAAEETLWRLQDAADHIKIHLVEPRDLFFDEPERPRRDAAGSCEGIDRAPRLSPEGGS
jgi:hypothetical protein